MAFPTGWPPRPSSGVRSIRFYKTGTATANWSDNAYLFNDLAGANTFLKTPVVPAGSSGPGVTAQVGTNAVSGSPSGAGPVVDLPPGETNVEVPMIWSNTIRICNDGGGTLEYSFAAPDDASTLVHGKLLANESVVYRNRFEAGIALRGASAVFRVEAW